MESFALAGPWWVLKNPLEGRGVAGRGLGKLATAKRERTVRKGRFLPILAGETRGRDLTFSLVTNAEKAQYWNLSKLDIRCENVGHEQRANREKAGFPLIELGCFLPGLALGQIFNS